MMKSYGLMLAGASWLFASVSTAGAQGLDRLLPKFGETTCYGRVYDGAHLARHPHQLVTSMLLSVRVWREASNDGSKAFQATIGVTVRGQSKRRVTSTVCRRNPGSQIVKCSVECDMGNFDLVASSRRGSLTLELRDLSFDESCDGGDSETFTLSAGADDRTFRLDPVERSYCRDLEKQFERKSQ